MESDILNELFDLMELRAEGESAVKDLIDYIKNNKHYEVFSGFIDEERLKRKLRIYEAHERKVREQRMEQIEVKRLTDVDYYKDIYNKVNEGIIGVEDLTSDEFSKILKMQKLEYEVITKKLKDAMDNL